MTTETQFATQRPEWIAACINAAISEYDRRSTKARRAGYGETSVLLAEATAAVRAELERLVTS